MERIGSVCHPENEAFVTKAKTSLRQQPPSGSGTLKYYPINRTLKQHDYAGLLIDMLLDGRNAAFDAPSSGYKDSDEVTLVGDASDEKHANKGQYHWSQSPPLILDEQAFVITTAEGWKRENEEVDPNWMADMKLLSGLRPGFDISIEYANVPYGLDLEKCLTEHIFNQIWGVYTIDPSVVAGAAKPAKVNPNKGAEKSFTATVYQPTASAAAQASRMWLRASSVRCIYALRKLLSEALPTTGAELQEARRTAEIISSTCRAMTTAIRRHYPYPALDKFRDWIRSYQIGPLDVFDFEGSGIRDDGPTQGKEVDHYYPLLVTHEYLLVAKELSSVVQSELGNRESNEKAHQEAALKKQKAQEAAATPQEEADDESRTTSNLDETGQ